MYHLLYHHFGKTLDRWYLQRLVLEVMLVPKLIGHNTAIPLRLVLEVMLVPKLIGHNTAIPFGVLDIKFLGRLSLPPS